MNMGDLSTLHALFKQEVIEDQEAGLHPMVDQIEMFSFNLPQATLTNLIDIFETVCQMDKSRYFMCDLDDLRSKAEIVEHIPIPLKVHYNYKLVYNI